MNISRVAIFFVIALVILCYSNRETFTEAETTVAQVEYPDEVAEMAEVAEVAEVTEYPDEDEEISGYDEPVFDLSMKKIE